jgi:AbrB family looped-hinge helix DNA binding protein
MFSEKLLKLRKAKGYSQEALAEKLGVSRQTVAKWEAGDSVPDLGLSASIARVFGVTLDSLTDDCASPGIPVGKYAFGAVKMGERGQIVIPKKCREVFGLEPGDMLMILGDIERGIAMMKVTQDMFRVFDAPDDIPEEKV